MFGSPKMSAKALAMLRAMAIEARKQGVEIVPSEMYRGDCDLLMTYGLGDPDRARAFRKQVKRGKFAVGWDLGYFARQGSSYAMRLTFQDFHPQRQLRFMPPARWEREKITLRNDYDPNGPIVLCGLGQKARIVNGTIAPDWEKAKLAEIKATYPNRKVLYRPKPRSEQPIGIEQTPDGPIESAIAGSSLVVVRHSNVAIDACIAGIPVVCEDGAAAALYGSDLAKPVVPTHDERLSFLHRLAWFQWRPEEAALCWWFIKEHLCRRLS